MKNPERHISILEELAKTSRSQDLVGEARVCAWLYKHNRLIGIGTNSYKSDPLAARYGKNGDAIFLHAETAAIKNAYKSYRKRTLKGSVLYIARTRKIKQPDGTFKWYWGMAKPCCGCHSAIEAFGIKQVYYTTNRTGEFETLI